MVNMQRESESKYKTLSVNYTERGIYGRCIKRKFDFTLSLFAIIILSPLLLIVALLVRFILGAPVIFKQKRPGLNEKLFTLYKFRTMTDTKDEKGEYLPDELRMTRLGKLLRSASLDELPQLFNILRGDMSFIGPRPLLIQYLPLYDHMQKRRHEVRPGLSGLAQVSGRNALGWSDRLSLDVHYVDNIRFIGDLKIIFLTLKKALMRDGISSKTSVTMEPFTGNSEPETKPEGAVNKNKLLIIGASGHGKVVADIALRMNKWIQISFLDDDESIKSSMGIEVIGNSEDAQKYIGDYDIFVAVGNSKTRNKMQEKLEMAGADIPVLIHPSAVIGEGVELGAGTVVMPGAVINCYSKIGKGCIVNTGATVDHDNVIEDYVHLSPGVHLAGNVKVGKGSWLGISSVVINNKFIVNDSIIGAGAVVVKDITETGTYVGVPARKIK